MYGSLAPALVSYPSDLVSYRISDCSPVNNNAKKGYQERFIHGEIYKRFPEVNSVIHSHSENVLPFTISSVPMRPAFHIAGFLGRSVSVWDIQESYEEDSLQDMLVNSVPLGSSLANAFDGSPVDAEKTTSSVVLMRSHGFTTHGKCIKQAVYRAVYTHVNAKIQSTAITMRGCEMGDRARVINGEEFEAGEKPPLKYLDDYQIKGCQVMNDETQERPWALWVREVEVQPLYRNEA